LNLLWAESCGYASCYHDLQWNFRVGFTPREGLVIHTVAYNDGIHGRRSIAHRLSFVEMVVPYGDPKDPHYRKNAFDIGEDGLGKNCHSLKRVSVVLGLSLDLVICILLPEAWE